MKQKILFLLAALLPWATAWAAVGDEFTRDGMKYTVTSESPKEAELTGWVGEKPTGTLTILNYAEGYAVTSIGKSAFENCPMTKVVIQSGVRSIGERAFQSCVDVYSISIPESVTSIGSAAFSSCNDLYDINIPSGVTVIEPWTFSSCPLSSITIPEGLTSIGAYAFYYCNKLTSISIPDKVTTIADRAFANCSKLETVTIGTGVTSIGKAAFLALVSDVYMHANPGKLSWDLSGEDIGPDFKPGGSTRIHIDRGTDWSAFVGKVNGQFLYDPAYALNEEFSVGSLTYRVTSLAPATVEVCGYPSAPVGDIVIPSAVGQYAVTGIVGSAFEYCDQLTTVTIPESVTFIGREAFHGCTSVSDVYCYADPTAMTWDDGDCDDFKEDGSTLCHVKRSSNWSAFKNLVNVIFLNDIISEVGDQFMWGNLAYVVTCVSPKTVELYSHSDGLAGVLEIPSEANGWTVTSIASNTFTGCDKLTSVTIPATVTEIGFDAFYRCTGVTDVYIDGYASALTWNEKGRDDFKADGSTLCHVTDAAAWQAKFGESVNVTFVEKLETVILDDATPYTRTTRANVSTATYRKTIASAQVDKYQAWLLPFDYAITEDDETNFQFYKISMIANAPAPGESSAADDMWVFLTKVGRDDVLRANMPYVYKPKQAVTDYEFTTTDAELQPVKTDMLAKTETLDDIYRFYATYETTTASALDPFYYVDSEGTVSYGDDESASVGPLRWIIRCTNKYGGSSSSYAREMHFVDTGDDPTGIDAATLKDDAEQPEEWYTLSGIRLNGKPAVKGMFIRNGKKVLIR